MGKRLEIPFEAIGKVLIRSPNWIGDAVMSLPAVASVRLSFPRAEISLLAKPWVAEMFQGARLVDEVIPYRAPGSHDGLRGKIRLAGELKKKKFELALLLQNAFEAALISFLAGIPRRAGYSRDGRGFLLTHPVPCDSEKKKIHQVDYYLKMLQALDFRLKKIAPRLEPPEEERREARERLKSLGVGRGEDVVGISPGATYGSAKEWFPERYGELAGRIVRDLGARVLLFGSQGDRRVASILRENARVPVLDLTGQTTVAQAIGLISQCRLFITNDSGLMHVAAALEVPLIAIFGSTDPLRTGPASPFSRIVKKPVSCSPCFKAQCPEKRRCMERVTVDDVYEEVKGLWPSG